MPDYEKMSIGLILFAAGYVLLGVGLGFIFGASLSLFMLAAPLLIVGGLTAAPELYRLIKNR
jgi:hypothetical protein